MKMKRSIRFATPILILAVVALSGSAWARGMGRTRSFQGSQMLEELNLTENQAEKIKAIYAENRKGNEEAFRAEREKIWKAHEDLRDAMQKDVSDDELWKKFEAAESNCEQRQAMKKRYFKVILQIRGVLTSEQRKRFYGMTGRRGGFGLGQKDGYRRGGGGRGSYGGGSRSYWDGPDF